MNIDLEKYSKFSGSGLDIVYNDLCYIQENSSDYKKFGPSIEKNYLVLYQNKKYGDNNYKYSDYKNFYSLINIKISNNRCIVNVSSHTTNKETSIYYNGTNSTINIGDSCIFLYETSDSVITYGSLKIKKTNNNYSIFLQDNSNETIKTLNGDLEEEYCIYLKINSFNTNEKSYIFDMLSKSTYSPILVSRTNYFNYIYGSTIDENTNFKNDYFYYLRNQDNFQYFTTIFRNFDQTVEYNNGIRFVLPKKLEFVYLDKNEDSNKKVYNEIVTFHLEFYNFDENNEEDTSTTPKSYKCTIKRNYLDNNNNFMSYGNINCRADLFNGANIGGSTMSFQYYLTEMWIYINDYYGNVLYKFQMRSSKDLLYTSLLGTINIEDRFVNCLSVLQYIDNKIRTIDTLNFSTNLYLLSVNVDPSNTTHEIIGWTNELYENSINVVMDNGSESNNIKNDNNFYGIVQILKKDFGIVEYNEKHFSYNTLIDGLNLPFPNVYTNNNNNNNEIILDSDKIYFGYIIFINHDDNKKLAFFAITENKINFYLPKKTLTYTKTNSNVFNFFKIYDNKFTIEFNTNTNDYFDLRYILPFDCKPVFKDYCLNFDVNYLAIYDKNYIITNFSELSLIPSYEQLYCNIKDIIINSSGLIDNENEKLVHGEYYLISKYSDIDYKLICKVKFSDSIYINISDENTNHQYTKIIKGTNYLEIVFGDLGSLYFYSDKTVAFSDGISQDVAIEARVVYPYENYGNTENEDIKIVLLNDCLYATTKSNINSISDQRTQQENLITKDLFDYIKSQLSDDTVHYIRFYFRFSENALFSLEFNTKNKVKLTSYIVNNGVINSYDGSTFDYDFENLYTDFYNLFLSNNNKIVISKGNDTCIELRKDNLKIFINQKYSLFDLTLINCIDISQNYVTISSNEYSFNIEYYSTSTSLKEKPFYVNDLMKEMDLQPYIPNIIDTLKKNGIIPNDSTSYKLRTIDENETVLDTNLSETKIYIGFISFKSSKKSISGYSPIIRYNGNSYVFRSVDTYLGSSKNRFDYVYKLNDDKMIHNMEEKLLERGNNYDHFSDNLNYVVPFDSEPEQLNRENSIIRYNEIINYKLLTLTSNFLSFYSNEQFNYSDDLVKSIDGYTQSLVNINEIIQNIDKIINIHIVYKVNDKIYRDLYNLKDCKNTISNYYLYTIDNYLINFGTIYEKSIKLNRNISFSIILGPKIILSIDSMKFTITNYEMTYFNLTYNKAEEPINAEVKLIELKFKE